MSIDEALSTLRNIADRLRASGCHWRSERITEAADAIEAAMREPVAETWQAVIDRIAPAMEILSDHDEEMYPAEAALALDRARIRRELAALKPDATQDELVRITEQLAERDAEIERLKALWCADVDPIETEYAEDYRSRAALSGKEGK